jgi:hypothetical protein
MLNILLFLLDWILLSSFWLFPSAIAKGMSEFVAYPFTSSVAAKKVCSLATPQKKKVVLASRSVKTLAKDLHLPSIFDRDVKNHSSLLSSAHTTMTPHDFHGPLHNEHSQTYDDTSSDDDDEHHDHEPQYYHLPQQLEPHENHDQVGDREGELPIHYRYFGKSRPRLRNHDSIPFIFLGPSVDHWKMVGQNLASRGFSVMAASLDEEGTEGSPRLPDEDKQPQLVEAILEALRWNRAILVGCDSAAIVAIRAALRLAPEGRVAGVILCGDLSEAQRHIAGPIDVFLRQHMTACPFSVIWDGDQSTLPVPEDAHGAAAAENHRCLIRGGGSAPHRRLPEQFAWALTRFVEEQVAPLQKAISEGAPAVSQSLKFLNRVNFTPGGFLVAGRVLAEAVFYLSAMKVVMYQYENIYDGILRINKGYKELSVWPRRILKLVGNMVLGWSGLKVKGARRTVEPSFEETIIMPHMQQEEEIEKEQTQEFLPPVPTATRDEIRWPIPLINPVAV